MLKHLRKDAVKTVEKTNLYSKQLVYYVAISIDRTIHNGEGIDPTELNAAQITTCKKISLRTQTLMSEYRNSKKW